jgi:hypothetical protein
MISNIADRVVLASPELRMAPLGSDNLYARHKALLKQHALTKENIGLDIGVHYNNSYKSSKMLSTYICGGRLHLEVCINEAVRLF